MDSASDRKKPFCFPLQLLVTRCFPLLLCSLTSLATIAGTTSTTFLFSSQEKSKKNLPYEYVLFVVFLNLDFECLLTHSSLRVGELFVFPFFLPFPLFPPPPPPPYLTPCTLCLGTFSLLGFSDMDEEDRVVSVALLIDELRNEDAQVRLNSINKLQIISETLGPERTRNELVPYLNEFIDDEDEILLALAKELGGLVEQVGGSEFAHTLLLPLENLSGVEESVVRDEAVKSISTVIKAQSDAHVLQYSVPILQHLSIGDWFTSRISAAGLFAVVYPRVPTAVKANLRSLFKRLCEDETPMVRRSACSHIGEFAKTLEEEFVVSEILPTFKKLTEDEQDSVRLLTVDNCVTISSILNYSDNVRLPCFL